MSGNRGCVLVLSVDLELDIDHSDQLRVERLDLVRSQLIALLAGHRLAATWAVADPLHSAATEPVLAAGLGHDLAVLGDRTWIGFGTGRARLDRELTRRFDGARQAGIPVSTLALRNVDQILDLDLLLDHDVTAIRGPAVESPALARKQAAPPIRFGIWQAPPAWRIPPQSAWWSSGAWRIQREIQRAIGSGHLLHLEIDAPRLVESEGDGMSALDKALGFAAKRRDEGQLAIQTLGTIAAAALQERAAVPTRSILKPAA